MSNAVLDLDIDILNHLGNPESVEYLRAEQFSPELIVDPIAKDVFRWQLDHTREHGSPATPAVLEAEFPDIGIEAPQAAIGDLIQRLRERYIRNEGRAEIKAIYEQAYTDPYGVARQLQRAGRRLADLTTKSGESFSAGDFDRWVTSYNRRKGRGLGPSLGFKEFDAHFNGQAGITFMIASPKTYKSWFTINAVIENAMRGKNAWLYSLELPADESNGRLLCMAADVPYWKYLKGVTTAEDESRLKMADEGLAEAGKYKVEKPQQGERGVQRMIERALNAGADCVFIDQLQYIEAKNGHSLGALNNTGDYFEVVNDLRNYSDEIPIFIVHQFNRSTMGAKALPEMQQAKGSSAIEEVATLALGIWTTKEMRQENRVQVGTLASRNYSYAAWNIGVQLSHGCSLEMIGQVEDEEE